MYIYVFMFVRTCANAFVSLLFFFKDVVIVDVVVVVIGCGGGGGGDTRVYVYFYISIFFFKHPLQKKDTEGTEKEKNGQIQNKFVYTITLTI